MVEGSWYRRNSHRNKRTVDVAISYSVHPISYSIQRSCPNIMNAIQYYPARVYVCICVCVFLHVVHTSFYFQTFASRIILTCVCMRFFFIILFVSVNTKNCPFRLHTHELVMMAISSFITCCFALVRCSFAFSMRFLNFFFCCFVDFVLLL